MSSTRCPSSGLHYISYHIAVSLIYHNLLVKHHKASISVNKCPRVLSNFINFSALLKSFISRFSQFSSFLLFHIIVESTSPLPFSYLPMFSELPFVYLILYPFTGCGNFVNRLSSLIDNQSCRNQDLLKSRWYLKARLLLRFSRMILHLSYC